MSRIRVTNLIYSFPTSFYKSVVHSSHFFLPISLNGPYKGRISFHRSLAPIGSLTPRFSLHLYAYHAFYPRLSLLQWRREDVPKKRRQASARLHALLSQTTTIFRDIPCLWMKLVSNVYWAKCLTVMIAWSNVSDMRDVLIFLTRGSAARDSIVPLWLGRCRWVRLVVINKWRHEIGSKHSYVHEHVQKAYEITLF